MYSIRKIIVVGFCLVMVDMSCAPPLEVEDGSDGEASEQQATIEVTPVEGFSSTGEEGGPFDPETYDYMVTNICAGSVRWSADNRAAWLFLSRSSGRLEPGQSERITVEINRNAERLSAGEYEDRIIFFGDTEESQIAARSISLVVGSAVPERAAFTETDQAGPYLSPEPILQVDADRLIFEDAEQSQSFPIRNIGSKEMNFKASPRSDWVHVEPMQGIIQDERDLTVTVNTGDLHTGVYRSAVDIDAGQAGTYSVKIIFEATTGQIRLTPEEKFVADDLQAGPYRPERKSYELSNTGSIAFEWSATKTQSWVELSSDSGLLNPGDTETVTISISSEGNSLGSGVYVDSVYFKADAVEPVSVDVLLNVGQGELAVEPSTGLSSHAIQGGTVQPAGKSYTLLNKGQTPVDWQANATKPWISFSRQEGTLAAGEEKTVFVSINSGYSEIKQVGIHTATVQFDGGGGLFTIPVIVEVEEDLSLLKVAPSRGLLGHGYKGGPFNPSAQEYTLQNDGTALINWSVWTDKPWISISETSGELRGGEEVSLAVSFNSKASTLRPGMHQAVVTFRNEVVDEDHITRTALLSVLEDDNDGGDAGSGDGNGGSSSTMQAAQRTSGVAPLGVVFDATDSSSGVIQPTDGDYAGMHYEWDFGDTGAGSYLATGVSRNEGKGRVAAHVYEERGIYEVILRVTDAEGSVHQYRQTISVTRFNGLTYYVSNSEGSDANSGLTAGEPLRSYEKALDMTGPDRRILFKRGDTWTISGRHTSRASGPVILGAYGSGSAPRIQVTGAEAALDLRADNWRIMDLELVGPGSSSEEAGLVGSGLINNLALRLTVSQFDIGIAYGWNGADQHANNIIADCTLTNNVVNNCYVGGRHIAILGNRMEQAGISHVLRIWHMRQGIISHNILRDPGHDRLALKFHNEQELNLPDSQHAVISDNILRGHVYVVSIAPQWWGADERIKDVVFERNLVESLSDTQAGLLVQAQWAVVRNNVFDGSGASEWYTGIEASAPAIPGATNDQIYNNTIYRGDAGGEFTGISISSGAYEVTVRNNLASAPRTADAEMVNGAAVRLAVDHNLLTDSPGFVDPGAGDFDLTGNSPAIDAGVFSPYIRDDFSGRRRGDTHPDLGALEY